MPGYKVVLECASVKGFCPFYKKGDKITFVEPGIVMEETDAICYAFILNFGPWYRPLVRGITPKELGLTKNEEEGYIACHAPPLGEVPEGAAHGTVFFKIKQIPIEETIEDKWVKDLLEKGVGFPPKREFWPEDTEKP